MTINSINSMYDDAPTKSLDSGSWKIRTYSKKSDSFNNGSLTSSSSCRSKKDSKSVISPYLSGDRVKLLSRVTQKKMVHRKTTGFVSSFPLAANIYKANSDEIKVPKRGNKKAKKSVLTLPNASSPMPQACTVSDINDFEYNETKSLRKPKPKKRRNKKFNLIDKNIEIYDRDARYCSQLNINLDSSSTDMFKHLTGDGARSKTNVYGRKQAVDDDVWAVFRNINKMQFIPSPPMSLDSIESLKKKKTLTRRRPNDRKDTRFIETCRTEEIAYISYDSNSINSCSRSTSLDRVTVIGRQDEVQETCTTVHEKNNEVAQKLTEVMSQIRKRVESLSPNSSKSNNLKNKQDRQPKPKTQVKYKSDDNYNDTNGSNNNIINNIQRENLTSFENKKCIALSPICANTNGYEENRLKHNSLKMSLKTVPEISSIPSIKESKEQFNGITRIVVSNGKDVDNFKQQPVVRKPRLVTTMPSSPEMPRLTQADIKRRLAKLKFPIVVTGKDQLSTCIQVPTTETIQFSGLDKQMWPFMVNWLPKTNVKPDNVLLKASISKSKIRLGSPVKNNLYRSLIRENLYDLHSKRTIFPPNDPFMHLKSVQKSVRDVLPRNKFSARDEVPLFEHSPTQNKPRPMRQFRNKMLNLICNKSSRFKDMGHNSKDIKEVKLEDKSLANQINPNKVVPKVKSPSVPKEGFTGDHLKPKHTMWAKARWASDFIENVIRKVKSGVYYDQEYYKLAKIIEAETRYTQTEANISKSSETDLQTDEINEIKIIDAFFDAKVIPGFEEEWQNLELETISNNQIEVKHCVTNVVVQFDIALPSTNNDALQQKQSLSCIPIKVTESQTKVYKYKSTIMDSVLPAEICTILPKMLFNIFDPNTKYELPKPVNRLECPIKAITEVAHCDTPAQNITVGLPYLNLMPHVLKLLKGQFFLHPSVFQAAIKDKRSYCITAGFNSFNDILPNLNAKLLFNKIVGFRRSISDVYESRNDTQVMNKKCDDSRCTAMVPYVAPELDSTLDTVNPSRKLIDIVLKENFYPSFNLGICAIFTLEKYSFQRINHLNPNSVEDKFTLLVNTTFNMDLLYKSVAMYFDKNATTLGLTQNDFLSLPESDCTHLDSIKDHDHQKQPVRLPTKQVFHNVKRKISSIRLKKKCKSTSSISNYKRRIPLQKIANLDEFFQVIGLTKDISGVIDGNIERKILSSILDMKNWVTEISPQQAMLVLLLANKKESSNLIRFRAVVLQGIALNRITKASELDMEIEVIEREHLNKLFQCEDIAYLPATTENQDKLLEELCLIAKTTASDYQRPFDKSSESLLKRLVSKRKKLNPSYLRVLAKYVGLGLLKS